MLCGDINGNKSQERGDICKYIADSLCCIAEMNPTLQSNYTPIKTTKKKKKKKENPIDCSKVDILQVSMSSHNPIKLGINNKS